MRRRDLLTVAATGTFSLLSGCTGSAPDPVETHRESTDWPLHAHDATNSNHLPAAGPRSEPDRRWQRSVAERRYGYSTPSPVLADGVVYVGGDGLYAIDAADGSVRWRRFAGETMYGPGVVDGTVYVPSRSGDDWTVRAVDAADGSVRWSADGTLRGVRFRPVVVTGDTVLVTANYGSERPTTPSDGTLFAFATGDGAERWRLDLGSFRNPPPAVRGTSLFLGGAAGGTAGAFDLPGDGGLLGGDPSPERSWRGAVPIQSEVAPSAGASSVVYGDREFSAGVGGSPSVDLFALSSDDGGVEWRSPAGIGVPTPARTGDRLYAASTVPSDAAEDDAVDRPTDVLVRGHRPDGTTRWQRRLPAREGWAAPVATSETVFVATHGQAGFSEDPRVTALDAADGAVRWERSVPATVSRLAAADGALVAGCWDGTVFSLGR